LYFTFLPLYDTANKQHLKDFFESVTRVSNNVYFTPGI